MDFKNMYYELMGKICDLQEFLESTDEKNDMILDTYQLVSNIIEQSEELYINASEKSLIMC